MQAGALTGPREVPTSHRPALTMVSKHTPHGRHWFEGSGTCIPHYHYTFCILIVSEDRDGHSEDTVHKIRLDTWVVLSILQHGLDIRPSCNRRAWSAAKPGSAAVTQRA